MRIGSVEGISFKGSLIDSHMHGGNVLPDGKHMSSANNIDTFVKSPLEVTVQGVKQTDIIEKILLSNMDCLVKGGMKDEIAGNLEMLDFCNSNPKYFALAVCQPSKTDGNAKNISKLLKENPDKFVGLKFHPRNFNLSADDNAYKPYMRLAERYNLPCLFHSDVQIDAAGKVIDKVSSPEAIYRAAKRFPDVPVIMAHMGAGDAKAHQNAIDILLKSLDNKDAKLYVDISWVDWGKDGLSAESKPSIVKLIQELQKRNATDRILFGTDAPLGCFGEAVVKDVTPKQAYEKVVSDLKTVIKDNFKARADELIEKIFYKNADELFFKKDWTKIKNTVTQNTNIGKAACYVVGGLAVLSGIGYVIKKLKPVKESRFDK